MAVTVYQYRPGHEVRGVDADTVGRTITALMDSRGGSITPRDVVEESRPVDAPLHGAFEWQDSVAAEKYREQQARQVIRSYVVVQTTADGQEKPMLANVSIAAPYDRNGPAYVPATRAFENRDLRERILAMALAQLDAWQARFGHLQELAGIADAIRDARAAREAAAAAAAAAARKAARRQAKQQPTRTRAAAKPVQGKAQAKAQAKVQAKRRRQAASTRA